MLLFNDHSLQQIWCHRVHNRQATLMAARTRFGVATVARQDCPDRVVDRLVWSAVAWLPRWTLPVAGEPMTVSFRFLSPDAPVELLQPGSRFELIEGERVVAVGEVLFNDETGSVHLNNQRFPE
ncbi:hypothetical protein [Chloroflexus sp.]|uniref:hypothetical protein n=2 Tax=Chloroflexaceae TaxID=1106 RepID=UPI002ADE9187|nr:hypothetical protein [Chloroflexus sp.]